MKKRIVTLLILALLVLGCSAKERWAWLKIGAKAAVECYTDMGDPLYTASDEGDDVAECLERYSNE